MHDSVDGATLVNETCEFFYIVYEWVGRKISARLRIWRIWR